LKPWPPDFLRIPDGKENSAAPFDGSNQLDGVMQ